MKKQSPFIAYILIGVGLYFLFRELKIPLFTNFYSWQTFLIIIGIIFIIYSYVSKKHHHLFGGSIILGLGIHFHGLEHYDFWIDHWAVYPLIIGIAFIIRYIKTKEGFFTGILLIIFSSIMMFSPFLAVYFDWIYIVIDIFERFWPIILIIIGIYLLKKK